MTAASDLLTVTFHPAVFGWVSFDLRWPEAVFPVRAPHWRDPFPQMIPWLEGVVAGAAASRWTIDEEGCAAQLVYLAPVDDKAGDVLGQIVCHRSSEEGDVFKLAYCPTTPAGLVQALYGAFRAYATGPDYVPEGWETPPSGDPEDGPWRGDALREIRSDKLDAILMQEARS